jgi:hypothetical protein
VEVQPKPVGQIASGYDGVFLPISYLAAVTPNRALVYTTTLVEAFRHAMWMDAVEQLQAVVDSCLVERGYRQFRLTDRQMSTLRSLPRDAPERQYYLHSLGSSEAVLAAQAI